MPLLLQKNIADDTKLAVWKIEEDECFFLEKIQLQQDIHHPHKRLQHLAGRYLLSLLVVDFPFTEIRLNEAGKPYLPSGIFRFSISHCGDYAAAIISAESGCGIDIELFSSKTETVKHKYLSEEELKYVDSLQNEYAPLFSNHQLYTLCWCAKETVYKWWGKGKLDFKKNMRLQYISLRQEEIGVSFIYSSVETKLILHLLLLEQASLVWTIT